MDKLFGFIGSALDFVDSGRFFRDPFKWVYYLLGVTNFAIPLMLIVQLCNDAKYMPGKSIFMTILMIIFALAIAFFACVWWFKRGNALVLDARAGSRFVAIPMISNLTQTFGEVIGLWVGAYGFIFVLVGFLFMGDEVSYLTDGYGLWCLIIFPVAGYLIVLFSRFLAELYLALASIANNTQSIDEKVSK